MRILAGFLRDDRAVTSVEYSVMLALILMAVLAAVGLVGAESGTMWGNIAASLLTQGP